jgi:hypothetical protein
MPSQLSPKARALAWCTCVEAPLVVALAIGISGANRDTALWVTLLSLYHFVPLSLVALLWLWCFGHDAPVHGPILLWHALYWTLVFLIQTALTFPIVLSALKRRRSRATA